MTLFKSKYRVESIRLKGWDYAYAGWYFVTICTRNRDGFFGDVIDAEMHLSEIGDMIGKEWSKTPSVRPNVELDEWIVMPNHIHGIIVINAATVETPRRGVSTKPRLKSGSLGAIMGQFKSACTKRIWAAGNGAFAWQSRFYDHIIRDEKSLNDIRQYIRDNPAKWELDTNNIANLWM